MADQPPNSGLSPLDQIRLAEAEMTRKIIVARESSERVIAEARIQAALLKKQAQEFGMNEGEIRHKEIVSKARTEADVVVEDAQRQVARLKLMGPERMDAAIHEAVAIILGLRGGRQSNEP